VTGLLTAVEYIANKSTALETDKASNTKYPSVKAVYDYVKVFSDKITALSNGDFLGTYISLAALQAAYPTTAAGNTADVDPGAGSPATLYIYDAQNGWVVPAGSSGVTLSYLTTALSAYVKSSTLATTLLSYVTNSSLATTLTSYATKAYADALVVGLVDDRGNWDASGNTFPNANGSGTAGAILKGDLYFISVAGTLGGVDVGIGTSVRALTDNPGQTAANWSIISTTLGFTPENITNKSTALETDKASNTKYPSVKAVYDHVKVFADKITALSNGDFLGTYISLAALQAAYPTTAAGNTADVDPGAGSPATLYIYDAQNGWVVPAGSSGVTLAYLTTALSSYVKSSTLAAYELLSNKTSTITELNKNSTTLYPNLSALTTWYATIEQINNLQSQISTLSSIDQSFNAVRALIHFDGASFLDSSFYNNLITVSGAVISAEQSKFGGTSAKFNGTSHYISIPFTSPGSQNFCIEGWFFCSALPKAGDYWGIAGVGTSFSTQTFSILLNGDTGGPLTAYVVCNAAISSITHQTIPTLNTWNHVALVRNGSSVSLYLNGIKSSSSYTAGTNPLTVTESTMYIGKYSSAFNWCMDGYIDEFRYTLGSPRYTANFTPPTSAFPNNA
jgi:hypothetical protein